MAKVSVLGAGGWGLALALTLYENGHSVTVWSPFDREVDELRTSRTSERLLPGVKLPENIEITSDLGAVSGSEITVIATPSFAASETAKRLCSIEDHGIVVNVAKGFEPETQQRLSVAIKTQLPQSEITVLSGPSHAEEVARKIPTMLTVSGGSEEARQKVQRIFSSEFLRVYTNPDIIGVELGGALKNIIAVAAGVCDGMGLGDNSKAALITRGLAEMTRLGVALGAKPTTFAGLAGMGDLIVTCTSVHSRNHRFGELVGRGVPVEKALKEVGTVEGYFACKTAFELAEKTAVDAPIIQICHHLLYENGSVKDTVKTLMTRPFKEE